MPFQFPFLMNLNPYIIQTYIFEINKRKNFFYLMCYPLPLKKLSTLDIKTEDKSKTKIKKP